MKSLIHQSSQGALDIVGVTGTIEPGAPFDVPDDVAETLLAQTDLFTLAPTKPIEGKK